MAERPNVDHGILFRGLAACLCRGADDHFQGQRGDFQPLQTESTLAQKKGPESRPFRGSTVLGIVSEEGIVSLWLGAGKPIARINTFNQAKNAAGDLVVGVRCQGGPGLGLL
ncbi:hypothetical protein EI42_03214 [Thermosporothrix hazakensis]|uniref:Uncharacterized protein n=1 Tax=Thermosporothrix hazakensis TaxID=644383 RepID=A0A326U6M9_THEHA|nr:hypothetical protein EI42_03214 [Thermosporothrix hazakensis]